MFRQVTSGVSSSGLWVRVGWLCWGELTISGLTHLRNRDYDPSTGTFTTVDPIDGQNGTTTVANSYAYVGNDPLNYTDPLGLCRVEDVTFRREYAVPPGPDNAYIGVGETTWVPDSGQTAALTLEECQAEAAGSAVSCVRGVPGMNDPDDSLWTCGPDIQPWDTGGWLDDIIPDCIDIDNPNCVSFSESQPLVADILKNIAIGAGVVVCTAGTLGACGVAVFISATGASVVDASRACSTGEAIAVVSADVLLAWAGLGLVSAPLSIAGLPRAVEGAFGAGAGSVQWLTVFSGGDC